MLTRLIREINACASRMEQQHNETKQLVVNLMESGNLRNASINASLSEIESALALQGRKTLTISKAFAKTQTIYFSHFTRFMKKTSSLPVALKDWQPQDIEKYRLWRLSPKGWISKKRKVRSITVDKEVGAIRRMFNSARRQGLIEQNPVRDLEVIPDDAPDTTFRTHDEIVALEKAGHLSKKESIELRRKWLLSLNEVEELKALLWRGACQHYMVRPGDLALVIHIAADAGLRLGEINRLTTHEIVLDPEQGTGIITARSRKQSRTVREKERHVPIQGDLIKRLAAWIKGLSGRRLFHECKVDGHYRIDVYRALDAALKGTKFFGIRPHLLRHALRTNMYEAGVDEILIDAYLGHTTREMGDHYRHIRAKRLAAGAQMYAQAQARAASAVASSQTPKPTITLPRPGEAQTESDPNNTTDSAMKYNLHG